VTYAFIVMGAAIGAPLRYFLSTRIQDASDGSFPLHTLIVNLTGCFAIGVLATLAEERDMFSREARLFLLVGLLGSYTTFSTFGWETLALLRNDQVLQAAEYVVLSSVGGLLAVGAGLVVARWAS
jgi:CrcB protein